MLLQLDCLYLLQLPQVPEFAAMSSSVSGAGPKVRTDSLKLPHIDSRMYRALNPAPSNKSTAHTEAFLPSLFTQQAKVVIACSIVLVIVTACPYILSRADSSSTLHFMYTLTNQFS